jgi:hypothetical protein
MSGEDQMYDADSLEKNQLDVGVHVVADGKHQFDVASIDLVQRRLKQRHVQMYVFFSYVLTRFLIFFRIAVCHVMVLPLQVDLRTV